MTTQWGRQLDEFTDEAGPDIPPSFYMIAYDPSGRGVRIQFSVLSEAIAGAVESDPTSGLITSLLMQCDDDGTKHYVRMKKIGSDYHLVPDQDASTGDAITSLTMRADDDTDHLVVLRQINGVYHIVPDQDPL